MTDHINRLRHLVAEALFRVSLIVGRPFSAVANVLEPSLDWYERGGSR